MSTPIERHISLTVNAIPATEHRQLLESMLQYLVAQLGPAVTCQVFAPVGKAWVEPQHYGNWPP
jgi:hypothetical protein